MKKSSWKWWLLALLALVMSYVWYNAFQMMSPEYVPIKVVEPPTTHQPKAHSASSPEYQPPKTNPFQQPTVSPAVSPQSGRPRSPEPPPKLGSRYRITGILRRDRQSQVVLTFQDSSIVLSVGDSLGTWHLLEIGDRSALFGQGKLRDTLWLYEK
jgi:hypothetical protein